MTSTIATLVSVLAIVLVGAPPVASQPVIHTVGVLTPHREDPAYPVFFDTLRRLGYEEGRNLRLLVRSAEWKHDRLPALAAELVEARVDVIVAINTPGARAAIQATKHVPIVISIVGDPPAREPGWLAAVERRLRRRNRSWGEVSEGGRSPPPRFLGVEAAAAFLARPVP